MKVADLFTDYMVPLDGHHVATAMGYEQGLVNDDGSVDKTKMKKKWDEKKEADKKIGIIRGPPPPKSGNTPTTRLQQANSKQPEQKHSAVVASEMAQSSVPLEKPPK